MKLSADWYEFKAKLDKLTPPHDRPTRLSFEYADEEKEDTAKSVMTRPPTEGGLTGRKVMEWFSKKTSIAGVQIPNWGVALAAVVVILLLYSSIR
jgi:hypothetical protein